MKLMTLIGAIGLTAVLVPLPAAGQTPQKRAAGSQQVRVEQLPPAVTAAIQKSYPNGSIVTAYKTTRGTDVRYQLWVKETASAPAVVVTATPEGQIQVSKAAPRQTRKAAGTTPVKAAPSSDDGEPIAVDQLPKPVAKAIKDAYPKDAIIQAFKLTTGGAESYQIVLNDVAHLQPMRVFVGADGTFQKR